MSSWGGAEEYSRRCILMCSPTKLSSYSSLSSRSAFWEVFYTGSLEPSIEFFDLPLGQVVTVILVMNF